MTKTCTFCPSGYFQAEKAKSQCEPCDEGKFGPKNASSSSNDCEYCPRTLGIRDITLSDSSSSVLQCIPDIWEIASLSCHEDKEVLNVSFRDTSNWYCASCPEGASCKGPTKWYNDSVNDVRALRGFWRVPWNRTQF